MDQSNKKIRVVVKEPGKIARYEVIENTLEALQEIVDGYIEVCTLETDLVIICNEEGKLRHLWPNLYVCGELFVGTVIFAGRDGEEFADAPSSKTLRVLFPILFQENQPEAGASG